MWRKILRAITNITTTLILILLLCTVFAVILTKAAGEEPSLFGYQLKTVLSGSMEPEIPTGSIISIQPVDDPTRFEEGDVVTFRTRDEILVTHRIIEIKGDGQQYVTQGDNNNGPDIEPVLAENIVGEYTGFHIPYVGYVLDYANSKQGAVLLLILPGLLLIGYSIVTIWRTLRLLETSKDRETAVDGK